MRNPPFTEGEIYHVYNRGVEKRDVFQDTGEYLRYIHHLFELNDSVNAPNLAYHCGQSNPETIRTRRRSKLVDVLAFVLMPNHFHLLLRQRLEGGIPKFMQKVGTGYTMFFNDKNERSGGLFQGKYKAVHVAHDRQCRYVIQYIHLNPAALCVTERTTQEKMCFLSTYRWSSLPDYLGNRNFPSVTDREYMLDMFDGLYDYKQNLVEIMRLKTHPRFVESSVLLDNNQ